MKVIYLFYILLCCIYDVIFLGLFFIYFLFRFSSIDRFKGAVVENGEHVFFVLFFHRSISVHININSCGADVEIDDGHDARVYVGGGRCASKAAVERVLMQRAIRRERARQPGRDREFRIHRKRGTPGVVLVKARVQARL